MKNKIVIIIILLGVIFTFSIPGRANEINIKMEENEIVGLLRFLYGISEVDRASNTMMYIYTEERKDKSEDKIYIEKFKKIFSELPTALHLYSEKGTVKDITIGNPRYHTTAILYYYGAVSKDMDEFKFLISGIFPEEYINDLFEVIDYFMPVYEELYYNPAKAELDALLAERNKEREGYYEILNKAHNFYRSSVKKPEIKIIIVPIYVSKEDFDAFKGRGEFSTEGQSLGNLQIIETIIPPGSGGGFEWFISVHEIVHYFQNNSSENEVFLSNMKEANPLYGEIAGRYISEAIATIIQMYSASLNKRTDIFSTGWYNEKIIDGYAKALYPEVIDYIEKDKTIDKELALKATEIFKETFPQAPLMKEIVFQKINVMTAGFETMKLMSPFRTVNATSVYGNPPLNEEKVLENYEKLNCTQIFIIKESEINTLTPYKLINREEIKNTAVEKKNFVTIIFDKEKNIFNMVFVCEDTEKLKELLVKLNEEKIISEGLIIL